MADLDDTAESGQSLFIYLLVSQKFGVIEKIAQEPAQLPHGFLRAIKTTHDRLPGQSPRFYDGESENVEGLVACQRNWAPSTRARNIPSGISGRESRAVSARPGTWRFMRPPASDVSSC